MIQGHGGQHTSRSDSSGRSAGRHQLGQRTCVGKLVGVWSSKADSSDERLARAEGRETGRDAWMGRVGSRPQALRRQIVHCKRHGCRIEAPCQRVEKDRAGHGTNHKPRSRSKTRGVYRLAERDWTRNGGKGEQGCREHITACPQLSSVAAGCRKRLTSPLNSSRSRCSSAV
jgi:hypothetical protein